jgi:hypothetical protein
VKKKSKSVSYKKPGTLVRVNWGDAWGASGWASGTDHKPLPVVSVGFVIQHDEVGISLAEGRDAQGTWLGVGFIPNGMIAKVTKL